MLVLYFLHFILISLVVPFMQVLAKQREKHLLDTKSKIKGV